MLLIQIEYTEHDTKWPSGQNNLNGFIFVCSELQTFNTNIMYIKLIFLNVNHCRIDLLHISLVNRYILLINHCLHNNIVGIKCDRIPTKSS